MQIILLNHQGINGANNANTAKQQSFKVKLNKMLKKKSILSLIPDFPVIQLVTVNYCISNYLLVKIKLSFPF